MKTLTLLQEFVEFIGTSSWSAEARQFNPSRTEELIRDLQEAIWDSDLSDLDPATSEILVELAYDLDFFVASEAIRAEDPSYYGWDRLREEVLEAWRRVKDKKPSLGGSSRNKEA